jgi:hypothetical protein
VRTMLAGSWTKLMMFREVCSLSGAWMSPI